MSISLSEYKNLLTQMFLHRDKLQIPLCVIGSRGIGKSDVPKQVAKELGIQYLDLRLALMADAGDITGLPKEKDGKMVWLEPCIWPQPGSKGIVVYEEYNRATKELIQCMFQLLTDKKVNTHFLPQDWIQVAAINPDNGNYSGLQEIDSALARRFLMVAIEPDLDEWLNYEKTVDEDIKEFLKLEKKFFNAEEEIKLPSLTFNPFCWTTLSKFKKSGIFEHLDKNTIQAIYTGIAGTEAGIAFLKFLETKKLPLTGKEICMAKEDIFTNRYNQQKEDEKSYTINSLCEFLNKNFKKMNEREFQNLVSFWNIVSGDRSVVIWTQLEKETLDYFKNKFYPTSSYNQLKILLRAIWKVAEPETYEEDNKPI